MTPAALRARVRSLDRALRLPGAVWVEPFGSREWALDELLGLFDEEATEEYRQCEAGLKEYHWERLTHYDDNTDSLALRPAFPARRTFTHHVTGRTINRDLNVTTANVPEFRPYVDPEVSQAILEAIVKFVLDNLD